MEEKFAYLNLYSDDFDKYHVWRDVCDSVGVDYNTSEITIFYRKDLTETK